MILALFPAGVPAQEGTPSNANQEKSPASTTPAKPDYSQEPMLYESLRTQMRYENDGNGFRETHARILVQTDAGLALAGQLIFNYNAENETVEIRSVRVVKPDGSVIVTGPENIQDLSAPVAQIAPIYSDARQKHVTVSGLSVGDTIEYDEVVRSTPLDPGQFWQTYIFETHAVCLDEELELNVPKSRQLKLKSPDGVAPEVREDGDRRIYLWKSSNGVAMNPIVPPNNFKMDLKSMLEGFRPPPAPRIAFSTFESWADVGNWYAGLERDRREPTAAVRAEADDIVRGKTGETEKAEALYEWVARNIRYVSLSFGVGRYQPHAAADVLANRYGDCKDKSTLLEAFLAAEGMQANTALANATADVELDVPTPLAFDHAITFARIGGKETWLDSTIGVGPFGYLLPQLRGQNALVTSTGPSAAMRTTPSALPFATIYHFVLEGSVDKDENMDLVLKLDTRGDMEVFARLIFTRVSPSQFASLVDQQVAKQGNTGMEGVKLSDFKADDPLDTTKPFHVELRMIGKKSHTDSTQSSPAKKNDDLSSVGEVLSQTKAMDYLLPGTPAGDEPKGKQALSPLALGGPRDCSLELDLTVPPDKVSQATKSGATTLHSDFADFASNVKWDGQTLHASWRLNLLASQVSPSDFKAYSDFREKVLEALDNSTAKKGETTTEASKPLASPSGARDPRELFNQGQGEAQRQNYANAAQDFESALNIDPNYSDAWRELGRTYMHMGNYREAEAAFRKFLALSPDDHLAYLNMAWVLYVEKKYPEDADLLKKRVASAPDDGDALTRLGAVYLALHQPELAVPQLERAVEIVPNYQYAQLTLGAAYLETHQDDKAVEAFQRAINIVPSDNTLNNVAYELAEKKSSLDTAEKWSAESISEVELELNQATLQTAPARLASLNLRLSMYWDTMGWVKYQKGDYASAEKYVTAALQMLDDTTVWTHLGHIYAAEGKKEDAAEAYSAALENKPANRPMSDDEIDAASQIASLSMKDDAPGNSAGATAARERMRTLRLVKIDNAAKLQGIGEYSIVIGPDSKVIDLQPIGPDSGLSAVAEAVRAAPMPQIFPDGAAQKVFRVGTLACISPSQPCTLTLLSAGSAIRRMTTAGNGAAP